MIDQYGYKTWTVDRNRRTSIPSIESEYLVPQQKRRKYNFDGSDTSTCSRSRFIVLHYPRDACPSSAHRASWPSWPAWPRHAGFEMGWNCYSRKLQILSPPHTERPLSVSRLEMRDTLDFVSASEKETD